MTNNQSLDKENWLNELSVQVEDKLGGYLVILKGREILSYFEKENETWKLVIEDAKKSNRNQVPSTLSQIVNYHRARYNDLKSLIDDSTSSTVSDMTTRWKSIRGTFENNPTRVVHSQSPLGIFLIDLFRQVPNRAEGAYKYFNRQQINANDQDELRGFIDAHLFDRRWDTKITERDAADIQSLSEARNDWEQRSRDIGNAFDKFKTDLNAWRETFTNENSEWSTNSRNDYTEFVGTKQKEFENLKKTYQEDIKLRGPARFWQTRAKTYRTRGRWWLTGFAISTAVIAGILLYLLYSPPDALHAKLFDGDPIAVKGVLLVAAILSLGAYLVRLFARMTFSSFHLERDAEERRQLTMVYLALIKEGAISDKERDIVLQALFSRVDTGLLGVESSPTMPTVSTLIDHVSGKPR